MRYLAKNEDELVLPLSEEEEAQLEILKEEVYLFLIRMYRLFIMILLDSPHQSSLPK